MLKQQGLPTAPLDNNIEPDAPAPHQEIVYKGACFGEPCFTHPPNNEYGWCEKRQCYLTVDLAKRQKLCDHEQTRYTPQHKDNTPKPTKPTKQKLKKHST